jgi:NAD(P)-dependent dehydrogenase (short-subunit alcohol dehydrogenase family)
MNINPFRFVTVPISVVQKVNHAAGGLSMVRAFAPILESDSISRPGALWPFGINCLCEPRLEIYFEPQKAAKKRLDAPTGIPVHFVEYSAFVTLRPTMKTFENKTVLITGGASGIGKATAIAFGKEGANVVVSGRRVAEGEQVAREITSAGGSALYVQADVGREGDIVALVEKTVGAFGALHVAFNNAGTEGQFGLLVTEQTVEHYHQVCDVNIRGVLLLMKHEIPVMLRSGGGAIVNNSSIGGHIGFPGASAYVASKFAVIGLTKTAALEFAKQGVRVNSVSPGTIQTEMFDRAFGEGETEEKRTMAAQNPVGRIGTPEEIASAVLWLSSPGAAFTTGQDIIVDGGYTAR